MDIPIIGEQDQKPTLNVQLHRCGLKLVVSDDLRIFGPWLDEVVRDMTKTCEELKGVGLAAPQVNVYKRIVMVLIKGERLVLINPHYESLSKEKQRVKEACFSLPGFQGVIDRAQSIWIRTQIYEKGEVSPEPKLVQFKGFWAQVVQHELDHLDGRLYIDHLSRLKRGIFMKRYDEFIRISKMKRSGELDVLKKEAGKKYVQIQGDRRRHWGAAPPQKSHPMSKPPQPKSKWTELETKEASRLKTQRAQWRRKHPGPEIVQFALQCVMLRKNLRLTQQEFATRLKVTKQTVSRWERRSGHLPSAATMELFNQLKEAKNEYPKSL